MIKSLVISSNIKNINQARLFLEQVFLEFNLNTNYFNHVYLGLSEALANSIIHGNKSIDSKKVFISIRFSGNELLIEIEDEGNGFASETLYDPTIQENLKRERGRGIFLMRHFASEVKYSNGGRKVLIKYLLN